VKTLTTALLAVAACACIAQKIGTGNVDPEIVPSRDLKFEQKLNAQLPLDAEFVDNKGNDVTLADYVGDKPIVMGLIYYKCPSLCNQVLNGLVGALKSINFNVGEEFDVVMVGIDEREKPITADAKLTSYLSRYDREGTEEGWHFLTGDAQQIRSVATAVGYHYKFDIARDQYAHPAGILVITPEGKVSKYLLGVEYSARDLKLAVMDASDERIGSVVEQAISYCFLWDPSSGRYSFAIMRVLQVGGVLTVIGIVSLLVYLVRHTPTPKAEGEEE
jgi:protein SCO1/2